MKFTTLTALILLAMSISARSYSKEPLLHYIVREPKVKTANPPLLILLHGIGSNEKDLFSFANLLPDNFLVISARGPYTIGPDGYAWYHMDFSTGKPVINPEEAEKSRLLLLQFISQLKETHHFDASNVYLCGFSQGAIMSYSVGLTNPDKIKGIAVLSGRLLDEVKPKIPSTDKLKALRVFVAHGTKDNVLPFHNATEAVGFLKQKGITPVFKEYDEAHGICNAELNDLIAWLKS
jgi:phospholipase/carboxylesterase